MAIRHPYKTAHKRFQTDPVGESMTEQAHKKETDINRIMQKYQDGALVAHVNRFHGEYGNFTNAPDYHTAMNRVIEARDMFMTLPSSVRKEFANDPGQFLEFVGDPKNAQSLIDMGLAEPAEGATGVSPEPTPVTPAAPSPEPAEPPAPVKEPTTPTAS